MSIVNCSGIGQHEYESTANQKSWDNRAGPRDVAEARELSIVQRI